MVIHDDVLGVIIRGAEKAVPGLGRGEAVVEDDGGVAGAADGVEAVAVVGFGGGAAAGEVGQQRFVEELDGDDNILVGGGGVFARDLAEDVVVGEGGGVAGGPGGSAGSEAGVVEAVLREGCSCRWISIGLEGESLCDA
jgi:hypothetical protein